MRITSSLVAFIFIGVAAAVVIPDIAGRNVDNGGNGGHGTFVHSSVHSHPSGSPTGAPFSPIPISIPPHSSTTRSAGETPTIVPSVQPISPMAEQTGGHSQPSGFPTGTPERPTPSAGNPSHSPASRGPHPTGVPPHHSGSPSGISNYPTPSAGGPVRDPIADSV